MRTEDYPRTLAELERRFSAKLPCRWYLVALRWLEEFRRFPSGTGAMVRPDRSR
jgi:hypothetical protein